MMDVAKKTYRGYENKEMDVAKKLTEVMKTRRWM
jgi:hypothetical protein